MKKHYINKRYNGHGVCRIIDPYNPLKLPPNTVRVRTSDGNVPSNGNYDSATLVTGTTDVYDVYKSGNSFYNILRASTNVVEVLGVNSSDIISTTCMFDGCTSLTAIPLFDTSNVIAFDAMFRDCSSLTSVPLFDTSRVVGMHQCFNRCSALTSVPLFDTSNVTNMYQCFNHCSALTSVPLFDTSNVTDMGSMLNGCSALTYIPLFNTSNVTNMSWMLYMCINVQSGSLALYQKASSQVNPPTNHSLTFYNCGINTQTGSAELAQIPVDWK